MINLQKTRKTLRRLIDRFVMWWDLRQARNAANKYNLDFEHNCVFDEQLRYGRVRSGNIVKVAMISGKTGLYKAGVTEWHGDTGQKSWRFEFQGYAR